MSGKHDYKLTVKWTGNTGNGTSGYKEYERSHSIIVQNKPEIYGSSDPSFRGDLTKYNPEELLIASLSACHMLWFLHVSAEAGVVVTNYIDNAEGTMRITTNGGGKFTEVLLNPIVTVANGYMVKEVDELHKKANELCFIANSVNFPVLHKSIAKVADDL